MVTWLTAFVSAMGHLKVRNIFLQLHYPDSNRHMERPYIYLNRGANNLKKVRHHDRYSRFKFEVSSDTLIQLLDE